LVRFYPYAALAKQCVTDENPTEEGESDNLHGSDAAPDAATHLHLTSDLARLVEKWPMLPPHIKAAVMALVGIAPASPTVDPKSLDDALPPGFEQQGEGG
jgi:hypothetical protein